MVKYTSLAMQKFYNGETMAINICNKCSSRGYCANREKGMMACINFNKFPADKRESSKENDACQDSRKY